MQQPHVQLVQRSTYFRCCCRSGYSKHPNKQPWVLTRVSGEAVSAEPLEAITPGNPPEAVVAAQVQAFRCVVWMGGRVLVVAT
jgi:hypothetical protein